MFTLNSTNFKTLIESVYLSGIINECVVNIKNGIGLIQSIDKSNSLFVSNHTNITDDKKFELGIGFRDLSMLLKILNTIDNSEDIKYEISKDNKYFVLNIKEKGKVKLLLIEPENLVTAVNGDGIVKNLKKGISLNIELTEKIKNDILYFLNVFKNKTVNFSVVKNNLYFQSHEVDVNQFKVSISKVKANDLSLNINGTSLLTILLSLNNKVKSNLYLGEDNPVLISSVLNDDNFIWALSPILI